MSINAVIDGIQDLVGAVTGIRAAPDEVPEKPSPGLFAIAYPGNGRLITGDPSGEMKGLHNITLEVITEAGDKQRAVLERLYPFGTSIPLALAADPTFGSSCDTFGEISYTFGNSPMYGEGWMGWIFTIQDIKTHDTY